MNKIITCIDVPVELLDKNNAKLYFRQFGRIIRLCLRPKSRTCSIEYNTATSAQRALLEAGEYNGQKFIVAWERKTPKKQVKKKDDDPDWKLDPEVRAELEAMNNEYPSQYNLRSENKMEVEPIEKQTKMTMKKTRKSEQYKLAKNVKTMSHIEQQDLLTALKQPALTLEEKYKMLETRDKLIRLYSEKNTDMSKAKTTIGTCPDMCPEKERIMREFQSQVHYFEQEKQGRGMNQLLAVKEYSRSSADQEVPLTHELRPISSLKLTMSYLMHNIMNLGDTQDVNIAEWYNFLWDRTRSIRKDITQQELCCESSVELIEQCARFHIHCSAHLVAEDPSVFDQKINTENLTKCLQTLKYMYHDLKLKGIYCTNESEFRAYIILLNLNDGNFMWEVQQLEASIVKSSELQFALNVYSSIDKNNYVKFFKLVRSTTYLNACILLRYFVQIRLKAIKTLLKSYTPRAPFTNFPMEKFTKLLAFEDVESAIDFIEYHGLYLTPDRAYVILDRKSFFMPELPYKVVKAINVIDSKRKCSIGEVACGKPLPESLHVNYKPSTSFNADGTFKLDELLRELNKEKLNVAVVEEENVQKTTDEVDTKSNFKKERSASNLNQTSEAQKKSFGGFKFDLPMFHQPPATATSSIFGRLTAPSSSWNIFAQSNQTEELERKREEEKKQQEAEERRKREEAAERRIEEERRKLEEHKKLEEERRKFEEERRRLAEEQRKQEEERRKQEEERRRQELERIKREEEKKRLEEEQRKREEAERKRKLLERKARERQMEIELQKEKERIEKERNRLKEIQIAVKIALDDLLVEVEEKLKQEKLEEIKMKLGNIKIKEFFIKWQMKTKTNKRKRKAVDQCPAWISTKTVEEEAEELYTNTQEETLKDMKRYKKGESNEIKIYTEPIPEKINFHRLILKVLLNHPLEDDTKIRTRLYWKINLSLPDRFEVPHGLNRLIESIDALFTWKTKDSVKYVAEKYKNPFTTIVYCLEMNEGIQKSVDTNGLIFMSKTVNEHFINRIKEALKSFNIYNKTPLYFVIENVDDIEKLHFVKLQENVSHYKIVTVQFTAQNLKDAFENGFTFLASNVEAPPLEMDTLKSFLFKYLATEPWKRIQSYAKWNAAYKSCLMKPRNVVKLYNEALEHLKAIVLDDKLTYYPNFPRVFEEYVDESNEMPCDYKYFPSFWNTISYRALIEKLIDTLKLPNYTATWPNDGKELERIVYDYCKMVFDDPHKGFYKIMDVVLKEVKYDDSFNVKVKQVLWTRVIETIATNKILESDFSLKNTPFNKHTNLDECFVTYDIRNLHEYKTKPWFYLENPVIKEEIDIVKDLTKETQTKRFKTTYDIDVNETLKELEAITSSIKHPDLSKRKDEVKNIEVLLKDLEESIEISHKISDTFTNTLKNVLSD